VWFQGELRLPTLEDGVSRSLKGLTIGFVQASLVMAVATTIAGLNPLLSAVLAPLSLISMKEFSHRTNYWGIAYTAGWGLGLWLIGSQVLSQVLSQWEYEPTLLLVGFYLALKVVHKTDREL
jgi:hypothetical protein